MLRKPDVKAEPEEDPELRKPQDGGKALLWAGVLILVSFAGAVVDPFWLALVPAAVLLALGMMRLSRQAGKAGRRALQISSAAVSASAVLLLVLALVGFVFQIAFRHEPGWLAQIITAAGWFCSVCCVLFAGTGMISGLSKPACVSFGLSLPIGAGVESALGRVPGFFLAGAGVYAGLGLFALSLILLSRGVRAGPTERRLDPEDT